MNFLQPLANSGVRFAQSPSGRRDILLSNIISLVLFLLGTFLFVAYYFWYGWSFVTGSIAVIALLCILPIYLNYNAYITLSRMLGCMIVPLCTLAVSIYAKWIYKESQEELDYFTFRFVMLASCVFPAVLFSFRERALLVSMSLFGLALLMLHDPLHSMFGVPYENHNLKSYNYGFTNVVILVAYFLIMGAVTFLRKISEDNEERNQKLIGELNAKNDLLHQKNREIEAQNHEISAQTENLNLSQQRLREAYEMIEDQKQQLEKLNSDLSSELMMINHDLSATNNELIKHNNELRQFSYTVSHNLRGPVASLSGLINLIDHSGLTDQSVEIFAHIKTSIQRLETVIKDLSQIIDIRNDIFHIRRKLSLSEEVRLILEGLKKEIDGYAIKITTDFKDCDFIYSVRPMIHSILYNLISNAIKYRAPDRRQEVSIKATHTNNAILIEVCDAGLGIDLKNQKQNLFKLYKRFHFHTEGKGLGLYLVKLQTEVLGGRIDVESEINRFTRFKISIPLTENIQQQLLYKAPHARIFYDAKLNSTGVIWHGPVSSEQYREVFLKCLEFVKTFNTPNYLADLTHQGYIAREDQQWMFHNIFPEAARYGLKIIATIRPDTNDPRLKEYFDGIRQTVQKLNLQQEFFQSVEEASTWLEHHNEKSSMNV